MIFLNKLFGAIARTLLYSPLIVLQTALVFFLFIDKLIQGEYRAAFWTLLLSPLQALTTLFTLMLFSIEQGWNTGFFQVITPSIKQIMTLFSDVWETEPNFFFAVFMPEFLDMYEGPFFGRLLRKLTLFNVPTKIFELYRNHHDSPHSPRNTMALNEAYKRIVQDHAVCSDN